MKTKLILFMMLCTLASQAQNVYKAKNGRVRFFSDAPLEDIEATSTKASAAFNISTGETAVLIPINSFQFDKKLMQEHFNENYMESAKFPTAALKGKLQGKVSPDSASSQKLHVAGDLTIHGVTRKVTLPVLLQYKSDGSIQGTSKFMVKLQDYDIKIPQLVFQNIAEEVEVSIDLTFLKPNEK